MTTTNQIQFFRHSVGIFDSVTIDMMTFVYRMQSHSIYLVNTLFACLFICFLPLIWSQDMPYFWSKFSVICRDFYVNCHIAHLFSYPTFANRALFMKQHSWNLNINSLFYLAEFTSLIMVLINAVQSLRFQKTHMALKTVLMGNITSSSWNGGFLFTSFLW